MAFKDDIEVELYTYDTRKLVEASHYEVISAFYELSRETRMWAADLDYLFWCYCADGKAEICSANPKCDKCVIRGDCNKFR